MKNKLLTLSIYLSLFACDTDSDKNKADAGSENINQSTEILAEEISQTSLELEQEKPEDLADTLVQYKNQEIILPEIKGYGPIPYKLDHFKPLDNYYIPEFAEMVFTYKDSTDDKTLIDLMIKHDIIYDIYSGSFNEKIEDSNPHIDDFRKIKITGSDDWFYFMDVDFDNALHMPNSALPFRAQIVVNDSGEIVYFFEAHNIKFIHLNDPEAYTLLVHFVTTGYSGTYFLMQMNEGKMAFVSPHKNPNHDLDLYLTVHQSRYISPWPNDRHLTIIDVNNDGYEDLRMRCIHYSDYIDMDGILDLDTVDLDDDKYKDYIKRNYYHFEELSYLYDPKYKSYYLSQEEIPYYDSLYLFINPDRS